MLLLEGVLPDSASSSQARPLHYAAFGGHIAAVELLLEFHANVNAVDNTNQTALHMATLKGSIEIVTLLLSKGADPSIVAAKTLWTPLHLAAQQGFHVLVGMLAGAKTGNVNFQDSEHRSALHWVCFRGDMSSTLMLLEHGADPMLVDGNNHSAVEVALAKQYKEISELLLARIGSYELIRSLHLEIMLSHQAAIPVSY